MNALTVQALVALLSPPVIQFLKRSQHPLLLWIDRSKPHFLVAINFLTALLTSAGIHILHVPGSLTISWTGLESAVPGLCTFLLTTLIQFGGNHMAFAAIWKSVLPAPSNLQPPAK
jgi:hypothetical protein